MPAAGRPSLYEILDVAPDASRSDLARAYRRRARDLHPDRAPAGRDADEEFTTLTQAYRLLSDPTRRAAYDAAHHDNTGAEDTAPPATLIPVPIRHIRPAATAPAPRRGQAPPGAQRPPIIAGPTYIDPYDPEATR
jgi:curved DNA-binding protein CbpA